MDTGGKALPDHRILKKKGRWVMEFEQLLKIIAEVKEDVDIEEITPDTRFVEDLGADSLDVLSIVEMIESEFQISIADDELMKISTVQDAYDAIEKYL
jgi:acyl carrier protein